jgi:hypothetical protein
MMGLNHSASSGVLTKVRLLRGLAGHVLPCGCLVGVYETYSKEVVATIDACGPSCESPGHRLHQFVDLPGAPAQEQAKNSHVGM